MEEEFLEEVASVCGSNLNLQIGDLNIVVHAGDDRVMQSITDYYGGFVSESVEVHGQLHVYALEHDSPVFRTGLLLEQPRDKPAKQAFYYTESGTLVVYRYRTRIVYYIRSGSCFVIGPILDNLFEVFNLVSFTHSQHLRKKGYHSMHASAASLNGEGIVFAGTAGVGKTTVTLMLMQMGFDFVTNDRVIFHKNPETGEVEVSGVPKWPRVNAGTMQSISALRHLVAPEKLEEYDKMSMEELYSTEEKYDVHIPSAYGAHRITMWTKMKVLVVLTWKPFSQSQTVCIRRVPANNVGHLLCPLLKQKLMDPRSSQHPSVQLLNKELANVTVLHVSGKFDTDTFFKKLIKSISFPTLTMALFREHFPSPPPTSEADSETAEKSLTSSSTGQHCGVNEHCECMVEHHHHDDRVTLLASPTRYPLQRSVPV